MSDDIRRMRDAIDHLAGLIAELATEIRKNFKSNDNESTKK